MPEEITKNSGVSQAQAKIEQPIVGQMNRGSFVRGSPDFKRGPSDLEIESSDLYQELKSAHDKEYENNLKLTKVEFIFF